MLAFQLAMEASNVKTVNPLGTVAVCSLWTPAAHVWERLKEKAPALLGGESPIAVIGGLYGGGLKIMLRNLHHNPQLDTVVLCGKDFAGAGEHLAKFFAGDYERAEKKNLYLFPDGEKRELSPIVIRGKKTAYKMDDTLLPDSFLTIPKIVEVTTDKDGDRLDKLGNYLSTYRPAATDGNMTRPAAVPLPKLMSDVFPADRFAFSLTADTIVEAWSKLLSRLNRFAVPTVFRKGKERRELNNVKVVVKTPWKYDLGTITSHPYNISEEYITSYQNELLTAENDHEGIPYTYGNRIRAHFKKDLLVMAAKNLSKVSDSRHAYVSLWDNEGDMEADDSPCLVSLFMRKIDDSINMTAIFRSHNSTHAWPLNCFGLLRLMEEVAKIANENPLKEDPNVLRVGTLTVLSLSMTINPADLDQVKDIIEREDDKPYRMADDPNGYFRITTDDETKEIVVFHHDPTGELLKEYRGTNATDLSKRIHNDMALSDIGHALYLGGQLERAWRAIVAGEEYVQDKSKPAPKSDAKL
jgi:thymidylate synthase